MQMKPTAARRQHLWLLFKLHACIVHFTDATFRKKKKKITRPGHRVVHEPATRRKTDIPLLITLCPPTSPSVYAGSWGRLSSCSETMVGFWKCVCWTCGGGGGGGGLVWLCLAFLCVHPSVPPSAGMGARRVELGVAGISGSATRAAGFNVTASGAGVSGGWAVSAVRILSEGVQVPPNKCKGQ